MEKSYSCVPSKSSLTFYSKTITHFSKTNNPRFAYPDRQGRVGFFRRCEKISTPPPLTVWIFAVAISPPKTGNSAVTFQMQGHGAVSILASQSCRKGCPSAEEHRQSRYWAYSDSKPASVSWPQHSAGSIHTPVSR